MSQTQPLSKVLTQYNHVVETFHKRMQQDKMSHIDDMITLYAHSLAGGASDASLGYLEKTMANRDIFNEYRTEMDAKEWHKVDKMLYSLLGKNMNMLVGGQKQGHLPETNLIQSNRVLNAYREQLGTKMMESRFSHAMEFKKSVEQVLADPMLSDDTKVVVRKLLALVEEAYYPKLERDAKAWGAIEALLEELPENTANCILRCGAKGGPIYEVQVQKTPSGISASRSYMSSSSGASGASGASRVSATLPSVAPSRVEELEGGCGKSWKVQGGGGCGVSRMSSSSSSSKKLRGGGPVFQSPAAQQLYNLINSE